MIRKMKEMKGCELCSNQARIYCDSDHARLCWDCDEKVHSANFLVTKHCRSLLCHVCQTQTPWKASGPKLCPTISACENCLDGCDHSSKQETSHHQPQMTTRHQETDQQDEQSEESCDSESTHEEVDDDDDDGDYSIFGFDSDDDQEDDEDGENQVVPWSCSSGTAPSSSSPQPTASSSEEAMVGDGGATVSSTFNRMPRAPLLGFDDEDGSSSSQLNHINGASIMECGPSTSSLRPAKIAKTSHDLIEQMKGEITNEERRKRRLGIVSSLIRFQKNVEDR